METVERVFAGQAYRPCRRRAKIAGLLPVFVLSCLVAATLAAGLRSARADMEILDAAWTQGIDGYDATNRYTDAAPLRRPLYLWMRVRGDAATYATLKARGKLPLRHRWIHYVGPDPDIDTLRPTDEISVGGVRASVVDKLGTEIAARGYFDWRTWSRKKNLRWGTQVVQVLYADGSPVMCRQPDGGLAACVFRIKVGGAGQ